MSKFFTHFIGARLCITILTADLIDIMIVTGITTIIVVLVGVMIIIDMIRTTVTITGVAGKN